MPRRKTLSRSGYDNHDDYARDVLRSGGPAYGEFDSIGPGENSALLRAIYGSSEEEFEKAIECERKQAQKNRPHAFVRKCRTRAR